jgi:hypothetical protein
MRKFLPYYFITLLTVSVGFGNPKTELAIEHYLEEVETPAWIANATSDQLFGAKDSFEEGEGLCLDKIINLGKSLWEIIEANKPVLNVSYVYANALPKGLRRSEELDNFSDLQFKSYRSHGKNLVRATVYDLTYTVVHRYNGSYNDKGKYLENVSVIPSKIDVLWGYTVDFAVTKTTTVNVGTAKDPIGSLLMEATTRVSTVLKSSETHNIFQFRGDSKDFTRM